MDKIAELKKLETKMAEDAKLPLSTNLVFGEGNPDCEVLFIGEAPGFNEDQQKRPFVGRAGQLLRKSIRDIGWQEKDVYITNIVKRRPPDNRDPLPEEIESYKPYLSEQIKIIDPKIIVPLGRFSMNYFLPLAKITRDQGKLFNVENPSISGTNYFILPMLHPAAALRGNEAMKTFVDTFYRLPAALEKVKSGKFSEPEPEQDKQAGETERQKKLEDVQEKLF